MSGVELREVGAEEAELRVDRWFRRHFPDLGHGRLQKLLRTGQIRVDGRRVRADARLGAGQTVRIPPLPEAPPRPAAASASPADAARLEPLILYRDDALIVLDKPAGLAVQGGTATARHLDGMLGALASGGERPRLVHRLDRDTSGVLVVARTARAAAALTRAFREHRVEKLYWAIIVGRPQPASGVIDRPLQKGPGVRGETVTLDDRGRPARTAYRTVARAGKVATWLALAPLSGRTHQLRVHCAAMGTPILGDGKYGGARARLAGAPGGLMLHARALRLPHPDGGTATFTAPLPGAMRAAFDWLGFELDPLPEGAALEDRAGA